jgi:hypothetical protein
VNFGAVPPPVPEHIRGAVEAVLRPHFARDLAQAWRQIDDGTAQLWIADGGSSALVSRRWDDELEIWLMAGALAAVACLPIIEAAAREAGMTKMSLIGRRGWSRLLADWRVIGREGEGFLMEKDLSDGR